MASLIKTVESLYAWFLKAASSLQSPLLLAIRLDWGWQFWESGWAKLSDVPAFVERFANWGVPYPAFNVRFIGLLETVGGILLILGLASRLIALLLSMNMLVAFIAADREALRSIFSDPDKFFAAAPHTFLFMSLIILALGPGMFSLDTLIVWFRTKRKKASPAAA